MQADSDAFPVGTLQPVGQYSFHVRENRWEWSEEMYRLHGFEPGEVVPTTELVLRHKEPGGGTAGREKVSEAVGSGEPYSFWHRIIDAGGRIRNVVTVGQGIKDENGELVEIRGYLMDVTSGVREDASSAVSAAFEHRAVIDQAKGMLMLVHGVGDEHAFALLQKASSETNTKLYVLAERLVEAFSRDACDRVRAELSRVATEVLYGQGRSRSRPA